MDDLLHAAKTKNNGNNDGFRRKKRRHIDRLEVVSRRSLYGMHTEPQLFVKATLRDPADILRLAAVLEVSR